MTSTGHDRRLYNQDRSLPTTLYTFYTMMYSPQKTLKILGRVLWHLPVTTDGFIIKTGHCRRLYICFTQLGRSPSEYTGSTQSCTMTSTGHDRRLYNQDRSRADDFIYVLPSWAQVPQNTLKIHGRVLWLLPVTTDYFINVPHKN